MNYRGVEVFETEPNAIADPQVGVLRSFQTLDPGPGRVTVIDRSGVPTLEISSVPFLFDRAEVVAFRAFLARRKGQLTPFWIPTWQRDFRLYAPAPAGQAALEILPFGYSRFSFRRDLVVMMLDRSAKFCHRITSATWSGGPFETLTLETPLARSIDDGSALISFLNFARLATDDAGQCKWETTEAASAVLSYVTLPKEVPA